MFPFHFHSLSSIRSLPVAPFESSIKGNLISNARKHLISQSWSEGVSDAHKARCGRAGYILRKCNDWIYSHGCKRNFYDSTQNSSSLAKTNNDELERLAFNKKLLLQKLVKVEATFIGAKTSAVEGMKVALEGNVMRCRLSKRKVLSSASIMCVGYEIKAVKLQFLRSLSHLKHNIERYQEH